MYDRRIMTKKPSAQIEREIKAALAKPAFRDPLAEKYNAIRRRRHGDVLRAIRKPPVAVVMTDRNGRETLVVVTPEMSRPGEGPWRASVFWHDGPVGHVTRKTLGAIASELATDYQPDTVRKVGDEEVIAWTGTSEFSEGSKKVAEIQAWNEGKR